MAAAPGSMHLPDHQEGLDQQLTLQDTKYYKDDDLNQTNKNTAMSHNKDT